MLGDCHGIFLEFIEYKFCPVENRLDKITEDRGDRRSPSTGIEVVSSLKRLDFVDPLLEFSINLRVNREIYVVKRGVLRHIASSLKSEQIRDLPPRGAGCARVRARRQNYVFVPESNRRSDMS